MRKTLICPKCGGRKLWQISSVKEVHSTMQGLRPEPIGIVYHRRWGVVTGEGYFEAFICAGCGFTEWYAHGFETLKEDRENGIHFINNEPDAGTAGPMR